MNGVAYTKGSDLDNDHKEIHLSLDFIKAISPARQRDEIQGVLVHEMVHCWQWNAVGTAPGGLIEGIADFVRLKAGFSPPHWKKVGGGQWDAGYQHTAYFLEWIERSFGEGSVRKVNNALKDKRYEEDDFWERLFDKKVGLLWEKYQVSLDKEPKRTEEIEEKAKNSEGAHQKEGNDNAGTIGEDKRDVRSERDEPLQNDRTNDNRA